MVLHRVSDASHPSGSSSNVEALAVVDYYRHVILSLQKRAKACCKTPFEFALAS